jgi:hypothetical protein
MEFFLASGAEEALLVRRKQVRAAGLSAECLGFKIPLSRASQSRDLCPASGAALENSIYM